MKIPEEYELMSVFESDPQYTDDIKQVPFYYNTAKYILENKNAQVCHIELDPAGGEMKIIITQDGKDICYFDFKNIESLTILDQKNSRFMITQETAVTKIQLKPLFQIFRNEEIIY